MKIEKKQSDKCKVDPLDDLERGDIFKENSNFYLKLDSYNSAVNIATGETLQLLHPRRSVHHIPDCYFKLPPRKRDTHSLSEGNVVKIRGRGYYYVMTGSARPSHLRARHINSWDHNDVVNITKKTVIEQVWRTVQDFVSDVNDLRGSWNPLACLPKKRVDEIPKGSVFTVAALDKHDYRSYMKIDICGIAVCLTKTECGKCVRFEDNERVYLHNNATFVVVE